MNDQDEFLTTKEAAQIMRLSSKRVAALCDSGAIKAYRIGGSGHWRIYRKRFMQHVGLNDSEPVQKTKVDDADLGIFAKIRQAVKSRADS